MPECTHLDQVRVTELPESTEGCEECREVWSWCFVDEVGMVIPDVHGETRIRPSPMLS